MWCKCGKKNFGVAWNAEKRKGLSESSCLKKIKNEIKFWAVT